MSDVYALAANLRSADRAEVEALGIDPRSGIRGNFRAAILRNTFIVDGEIAAMSGLCGTMLGDVGMPYLMTAPVVERVPLTFVKQAKASVAQMLHHKLRLEGYVAANYAKACRLIEVLGFILEPARPFGSRNALFRRFWVMRDGC